MFRCGVQAIFTSIALAVATSHAQTLNLTSDATNPLTVGQTVTFSVHLNGLDTKELDLLVAAVFYDDGLLGVPSISPGSIIPLTLDDPSDFLISEIAGLADATFLTFGTNSADHIVSDGVFFSFDVIALAAGTGSLSFDFVDATEFNSSDPSDPILLVPIADADLSFAIVSAVPEPSTFTLLAAVVLCFWYFARPLRRADPALRRAEPVV